MTGPDLFIRPYPPALVVLPGSPGAYELQRIMIGREGTAGILGVRDLQVMCIGTRGALMAFPGLMVIDIIAPGGAG